jgi:hypothetical protein
MPPEYPIHDKEGHLEFVLGMFFNTRQLVGLATEVEIRKLTPDWQLA